jgi:uracil phosphoribosyltransferase
MESAYTDINPSEFYLKHKYGENILISQDIVLHKLLSQLGSPKVKQPLFNMYLKRSYEILFHQMFSLHFAKETIEERTRMFETERKAIFKGDVIQNDLKLVCVDLARAGMLPTQLLFEYGHLLFQSENIRQDHIYAQRITNENQQVIGTDFSGSKVGGTIEDSYVVLADPMGATGSTMVEALNYYKNKVDGKPIKFIAVHIIITPEYIKKMKETHPDLIIIAGRLDRGLSSEDILKTTPGEKIDEEKGLNNVQYIIPGAGGVGEIINNSFV